MQKEKIIKLLLLYFPKKPPTTEFGYVFLLLDNMELNHLRLLYKKSNNKMYAKQNNW